jgi:hypothetical protein
MSATINELRSNNTSGVPGLRLRRRNGTLFVDATWYIYTPQPVRAGTSYPADRAPLRATESAMRRREKETGVRYDMSPRRALALLLSAGV